MNHTMRRERRKNMAYLVECGETVREVTHKFDVSENTVYKSCKEHGVKVPEKYAFKNSSWKGSCLVGSFTIIANLLNTDKSLAEIARYLGISEARVAQVLTRARKAGIKGLEHRPHKKYSGDLMMQESHLNSRHADTVIITAPDADVYERLWRPASLISAGLTIDVLVHQLYELYVELEILKRQGVVVEHDADVPPGCIMLVTKDPEIARKYGFLSRRLLSTPSFFDKAH